MNIIETIQKNLGFDTLKKIDPNTQEIQGDGTVIGKQCARTGGHTGGTSGHLH